MRFMVMHKVTDEMEKGLPPEPSVIEGVGKLVEEGLRSKIFVAGEGLKPTRERMHVAYKDGERTVTDGPFVEAKELVAGFALLRVRSREEALSWCDRFAAAVGTDLEMFVGPVVESWDLGMIPKPNNPPLRYLSLLQLDPKVTADPACPERMNALVAEMKKAGVLQDTGGLTGTADGARIRYQAGKATVVDGPFAESKELVAGYAIVDLPSKAAAIEWTMRFGEVVKVNEIEIRRVFEG